MVVQFLLWIWLKLLTKSRCMIPIFLFRHSGKLRELDDRFSIIMVMKTDLLLHVWTWRPRKVKMAKMMMISSLRVVVRHPRPPCDIINEFMLLVTVLYITEVMGTEFIVLVEYGKGYFLM